MNITMAADAPASNLVMVAFQLSFTHFVATATIVMLFHLDQNCCLQYYCRHVHTGP